MLYVFVGHGLNRIVGISKLLIVDVLLQFWDVNGRQFFVSKQLMLMLVMMMFDDLTAIVCRAAWAPVHPRPSRAVGGTLEKPEIHGPNPLVSRANSANHKKNLAGGWLTYPSKESWSSSVGMMTFPTEWKVIKHIPVSTKQIMHYRCIFILIYILAWKS